jgi:eukaryotic-like serine/threonine-protein kinase
MMAIRAAEGLQIDGFTLGKCLHQGGFATIWDVRHPDHAQPMVMKVPTILDGYDAPTIVGFEVEQMIMPRLIGPHVPRVIALGDFARLPYIVTEYIAGGALQQRITAAPLQLAEVVDTGARLAAALHDLHRQQVIHLDVKPANVLQRPSGAMVLIDYGLSRHGQLPDLLAEEFTIPMGTFPYIAPEQFLRERGDLRSDLFAWGVLMYQAATGQLPFGSPEKLSGVRRRLWADPLPPRALRPDLPEWLQEVILHALEVDPSQRYQSAAQLRYDLTHPAQIRLTARAHKLAQDGFWVRRKRRAVMGRLQRFAPPPPISAQIERTPILLVAVDLAPEMEALGDKLRLTIQRMLNNRPEARVACVNVIKTAMLGIDATTDAAGTNLHVARLVALRTWAEGIDLPKDRLTHTVLEHHDPAQAIIDHAEVMQADHIIMGARGSSGTRRFLGSVSAKVVAEAGCSVTVIRKRSGTAPEG